MAKKDKKSEASLGDESSSFDSSQPSASSLALVICRNKHWRYISSFHGPWLQLPVEVLETLANANYYMPLPRPVDPAVFFNLVKIRQLVDDATDLAVRAANGVTSSALSNSMAAAGHQMQALGLGFGNPHGAKLSPERRFKMREQATQKLSRAYYIDEIASSVATMQSTSTLENVADLVLQRAPNDPDAKYVHFFHEKIPSRQMAECTDFKALDLIVQQRPSDCEPLRTRATVHGFKLDFDGAIRDLNSALSVCRRHKPNHGSLDENDIVSLERRSGRRRDMPPLDESEQPSATEAQILFQRATCFLTLACGHINGALPTSPIATPAMDGRQKGARGPGNGGSTPTSSEDEPRSDQSQPLPSNTGHGPTKEQIEYRNLVRQYAKRALRDYLDFIRSFHYSPNLPIELPDEFTRQVNQATNRAKRYHNHPRSLAHDPSSPTGDSVGHKIYSLADLFAATPPTDLPAYPSIDIVTASQATQSIQTTTETVTYHPLLTDALHSILLCHALIQTSAKELQRHAYMVARLARLADGYPVFQASRSPARTDWIEVLRRADNWIELSSTWEALCAPAPLPSPVSVANGASATTVSMNALAMADGNNGEANQQQHLESAGQIKEKGQQQAIIQALEDEQVSDEASFKTAVLAQQRRDESDHELPSSTPQLIYAGDPMPGQGPLNAAPQRWAVNAGREYPILTAKADDIARWVREAPAGSGVGPSKRKKKPGAKKPPSSTSAPAFPIPDSPKGSAETIS